MDLLDIRRDAGLVRRAFDERRLDVVPWMPFSMSWTKSSAISSSVAVHEHLRKVVIGVHARRKDDLQAALVGHALAEAASRCRNSALGSTTVLTPCPLTALASDSAASHSACSS